MTPVSTTQSFPDERSVLVAYLDDFRSELLERLAGAPESWRQARPLRSEWTVLELAWHLRCVERRWLEWGFLGFDVGEPWIDWHDKRWHVPDEMTADEVVDSLKSQGDTTRSIINAHALDEVGQPSERWEGDNPPALRRILLHLIQEYARHLGHLDVVLELLDANGAS